MSWSAYLLVNSDNGESSVTAGEWGYTHNTNRMIATVLETFGESSAHAWFDGDGPGSCWFVTLNGMTGKESLDFLDRIIGGLMEAPAMFREMEPANGWGCYDDILRILVEMRACAAEWPTAMWEVFG